MSPCRDLDRAANARGCSNTRVDCHEAGPAGNTSMAGVYALEKEVCPR